ncbi:hypothetical protein Tco_1571489 [Tanacetum coccineum]
MEKICRVQRSKLLYSRTRQSDMKDYGKGRGRAGSHEFSGTEPILAQKSIFCTLFPTIPLKQIRRLFPRVQRPKLLYSRTRQSDRRVGEPPVSWLAAFVSAGRAGSHEFSGTEPILAQKPILVNKPKIVAEIQPGLSIHDFEIAAAESPQQSSSDIWLSICTAVERDVAFSDVAGQEVTDIGFAAACPLGIKEKVVLSLGHALSFIAAAEGTTESLSVCVYSPEVKYRVHGAIECAHEFENSLISSRMSLAAPRHVRTIHVQSFFGVF